MAPQVLDRTQRFMSLFPASWLHVCKLSLLAGSSHTHSSDSSNSNNNKTKTLILRTVNLFEV